LIGAGGIMTWGKEREKVNIQIILCILDPTFGLLRFSRFSTAISAPPLQRTESQCFGQFERCDYQEKVLVHLKLCSCSGRCYCFINFQNLLTGVINSRAARSSKLQILSEGQRIATAIKEWLGLSCGCQQVVSNSRSARSSKHDQIQCVRWTSVHYDHHDHLLF